MAIWNPVSQQNNSQFSLTRLLQVHTYVAVQGVDAVNTSQFTEFSRCIFSVE